jgi:hypothetical protein
LTGAQQRTDESNSPTSAWPVDSGSLAVTTRPQRVFAEWTMDILTYVTVINLFAEYVDVVAIDSFTISILTAVVLKVLLTAIVTGKKRLWNWAQAKESRAYKVFGGLGVWAMLFLSKFVILEVEDFIFGDRVELGGFAIVMVLSASLMAAREAIERIYLLLGRESDRNRTKGKP